MEEHERQQIIALVKREVVPAIGCTEPMAVALCVARATETLGKRPEKITALLSANILKNAMGVGIPGTGMIGLPIAIALGALIGKSDYQLEVLKDCTPQAVEEGKAFIDEKRIRIALKEGIEEKLYIEVTCEAGDDTATAIIAGGHTDFRRITRNDEVLLDKMSAAAAEEDDSAPQLTLRKVYDFAMTAPLDEIRFILETARMNKAAAERSFTGDYGHGLGKMLRGNYEHKIMGDSVFSHILSYTSGACDARMAGSMIPVMSNSGSGNQGISATLPVVVFAEENGKSEEELIRALMPDAEPPDGHLHQAEPGPSVCPMRLRGGRYGFQLRHHVADGRRLQGSILRRAEHDSQPDRHDLRRGQAQLRAEGHHGRVHRRPFRHHGHGGPYRDVRGGHHRRGRGPEHPQPDENWLQGHERDGPAGAGYYDA